MLLLCLPFHYTTQCQVPPEPALAPMIRRRLIGLSSEQRIALFVFFEYNGTKPLHLPESI